MNESVTSAVFDGPEMSEHDESISSEYSSLFKTPTIIEIHNEIGRRLVLEDYHLNNDERMSLSDSDLNSFMIPAAILAGAIIVSDRRKSALLKGKEIASDNS